MRRVKLPRLLTAGVLAGALAVTSSSAFSDTQGHWAEASIDKWSRDYQIIRGYDDGTFRPDNSITRGAFAGILDRFLHFPDASDSSVFSDVSGNYWEDAILRLHASGVYLGTGGAALAGNDITRQQAVTMIARAFGLQAEEESLPFDDEANISSYARLPVSAMSRRGYLAGVAADGRFRPTEPVTRAEVIRILSNMVQLLVQTPESVSGAVEGNVLINSQTGADLRDMAISGDLLLAPGAAGEVTLTGVAVAGAVLNFSAVTPVFRTAPESEEALLVTELEEPPLVTELEEAPLVTELEEAPNPPEAEEPVSLVTALENPPQPEEPKEPEEPELPGIQPREIYTPSATTGAVISYGGRTVPVYADAPRSRFTEGDFRWNGDRLEYVGSDYTTRFGIDVSAYQNRDTKDGGIDWKAVRDDGVDFAMVRLGFRGYSTGSILADKYAHQNIDGAMAAGLETGVYFFAQAVTVEEALEEADFVIEQLKGHTINGPVAYDWEMHDSTYRVYGTSPEMATACAVAFCERVREAGYTPMVYAGQYVSYVKYDQGALAPYLYWYPEYKTENAQSLAPGFYYEVEYWQFTDRCAISGITGRVDANLRFTPR